MMVVVMLGNLVMFGDDRRGPVSVDHSDCILNLVNPLFRAGHEAVVWPCSAHAMSLTYQSQAQRNPRHDVVCIHAARTEAAMPLSMQPG